MIHVHHTRKFNHWVPSQRCVNLSYSKSDNISFFFISKFPHLCFQRVALCLCITCQGLEVAVSSTDLKRSSDLSDLDFVAFAKCMSRNEWHEKKIILISERLGRVKSWTFEEAVLKELVSNTWLFSATGAHTKDQWIQWL